MAQKRIPFGLEMETRCPRAFVRALSLGGVEKGKALAIRKIICRLLLWDEAYSVDRAEEARAIAGEIRNRECRRIMGEIAEFYDRLGKAH